MKVNEISMDSSLPLLRHFHHLVPFDGEVVPMIADEDKRESDCIEDEDEEEWERSSVEVVRNRCDADLHRLLVFETMHSIDSLLEDGQVKVFEVYKSNEIDRSSSMAVLDDNQRVTRWMASIDSNELFRAKQRTIEKK